jgi:DNA-binding protein YbaB
LLNAILQNKEMLDNLVVECFNQAVRENGAQQLVSAIRMLEETKKQRFKRLLKEYARKNKGLVR